MPLILENELYSINSVNFLNALNIPQRKYSNFTKFEHVIYLRVIYPGNCLLTAMKNCHLSFFLFVESIFFLEP